MNESDDYAAYCWRVQEFRKQLLSIIERRTHPLVRARFDPEDVLAAVTLKCPRNVHQLMQLSKHRFFMWLQTVAHHRLIELQRFHMDATCRDPRLEIRELDNYRPGQDRLLTVPSCGPGPNEEVEVREHRSIIRNSLAALPGLDQKILRLRYIHDMDSHEVAALMGISHEVCCKRILRARLRFRRLLESSADSRLDSNPELSKP
jgi:RNA polymerase sigma factor (sigma-70 family)